MCIRAHGLVGHCQGCKGAAGGDTTQYTHPTQSTPVFWMSMA